MGRTERFGEPLRGYIRGDLVAGKGPFLAIM